MTTKREITRSAERNTAHHVETGKRIIVAEDDPDTREAWTELITSWGYEVAAAEDGQRALDMIAANEPQILLLDLRLPRKDGLQVLEELRESGSRVLTIVISGEGEIPDAVQTIKLGAYDYLRKPVDLPHLRVLLQNLTDHLMVSDENHRLRKRLALAGELGPLLGESAAMRRVVAATEQVASTNASVLIVGESGSGKEVVARTIHELSQRRGGPFVAINCAALPETLMESELFGHERGAFTGADRRREGCFEIAGGGTLLLDEITEMKIELQAKLLRVLEEQKLRRVGGTSEIALDVRVLATSNRELDSAIRENRFRQDLYYRLNVFTIEVPPLRNRLDDLPVLVDRFISSFSASGKSISGADHECLDALRSYAWPGNVRELRNVIERATVVADGPLITVADLPREITRRAPADRGFDLRIGASLHDLEKELILKTLESVSGNKVRAAEILGISLKTLYNRLDKYRVRESSRPGED